MLHLLFTVIIIFIIYYGSHQNNFNREIDDEIKILYYFKESLKSWTHPFILLSFFAIFFTSFSGLLNWGSSFLTIDLYKTYIKPKSKKKSENIISYFSMFLICCTSLIFTYFSTSLDGLIKVFFSISAGVAPVFVLRWFWYKINASTQIAAMISSGVYTLAYQFYFSKSQFEGIIMNNLGLTSYIVQLLVVTFLTVFTWLFVTVVTPNDNQEKIEKFKSNVFKDYSLFLNLIKAILLGVTITFILYLTLTLLQSTPK